MVCMVTPLQDLWWDRHQWKVSYKNMHQPQPCQWWTALRRKHKAVYDIVSSKVYRYVSDTRRNHHCFTAICLHYVTSHHGTPHHVTTHHVTTHHITSCHIHCMSVCLQFMELMVDGPIGAHGANVPSPVVQDYSTVKGHAPIPSQPMVDDIVRESVKISGRVM